MYRKCSTL